MMSENSKLVERFEWLPCGIGAFINMKRASDESPRPYRLSRNDDYKLAAYYAYQGATAVGGVYFSLVKLIEPFVS